MLPPLPALSLLLDHEQVIGEPGFLRIRRCQMRVRYSSGLVSEPFELDVVERTRLDAVVVAAHFRDAAGRPMVFLRSAVRPAVWLRPPEARAAHPERPTLGQLWELPAGLVEPEERSPEGLRASAARELFEELGVRVDPSALEPLGPSAFPGPGMIAERHFFFHVAVDPGARVPPPQDGSALEQEAAIVAVPVDEVLEMARRGEIEDSKTELAVRRLAEEISSP